jgi:bacillithiol biosynthesis deacetylase BshB1
MKRMDTRLPLDQHVDILAIGISPSDIEIGVGGTLLKMAHRGYTSVACDLIQGIPDSQEEHSPWSKASEKASNILHISDRVNLNLGDSPFDLRMDQAQKLAECLNLYRPDIVLAPYWEDCHPDWGLANQLIHKALYMVRKNVDIKFKSYTPSWIFYYPLHRPSTPQAIVNITSTFEGKMSSVKAYESYFQKMPFHTSLYSLSFRDFTFHIESRARHFGSLINSRFGEGLNLGRPIPIEDICEFISL